MPAPGTEKGNVMYETPTEAQINERKRWCRALISGDYEQGKGALCVRAVDSTQLRYCCLGVRMHQINPDDYALEMSDTAISRTEGVLQFESNNGELNLDELLAIGWTTADQDAAVHFNDEDNWTFAMIARGIGWTTAEGVPFAYLHSREPDYSTGDEPGPLTVPDSFSLEAWLES